MKSFNQVISVEVAVDTIANMLLETMSPEAKHREIVAEAIVGRMLSQDKSGLGFLYNGLCGVKPTINFAIGDMVVPEDLRSYAFWTPESIEKKSSVSKLIESAKVVDIDVYATHKLRLEFMVPKHDGTFKAEHQWVKHTECSRIPPVSAKDIEDDADIEGVALVKA